MPGAFQLISGVRHLCNVVRNCDAPAADASEDREVARSRQIGTEHASPANFQFDAEQSVLNLRHRGSWEWRKFVSAGAHLQKSLAIDLREPFVAKLSCDLFQVRRG